MRPGAKAAEDARAKVDPERRQLSRPRPCPGRRGSWPRPGRRPARSEQDVEGDQRHNILRPSTSKLCLVNGQSCHALERNPAERARSTPSDRHSACRVLEEGGDFLVLADMGGESAPSTSTSRAGAEPTLAMTISNCSSTSCSVTTGTVRIEFDIELRLQAGETISPSSAGSALAGAGAGAGAGGRLRPRRDGSGRRPAGGKGCRRRDTSGASPAKAIFRGRVWRCGDRDGSDYERRRRRSARSRRPSTARAKSALRIDRMERRRVL